MAKPKRTFSADVGQYSVGTAGPDQIEYDLDNLFHMLDPSTLLKDGSPGGIGPDNMSDRFTVDQSQSPVSNQGALHLLVGRIANRIRAVLGLDDWKKDPPITLKAAKEHVDDAIKHSGIAKINNLGTPGGTVNISAGTGITVSTNPATQTLTLTATGETVAAAHAATHATGGADPITPQDIGAATAGDVGAFISAHTANASAHHARYTNAEAIAAVWGAAGAGSGLDADKLRGLIPGNGANNLLKLGADGNVPLANLPPNLLKLDADGKVPLANLPPIQTRFLYAGDETECSVKGTTQVAVKTLRVVKSASAGMDIKKLSFVATLKTNGGTGYLRVYVDGTSRATLSTASTGYVVVAGEYAPEWEDNTVHTLEVRLNNSSTSYTTYNQVFEVYVE